MLFAVSSNTNTQTSLSLFFLSSGHGLALPPRCVYNTAGRYRHTYIHTYSTSFDICVMRRFGCRAGSSLLRRGQLPRRAVIPRPRYAALPISRNPVSRSQGWHSLPTDNPPPIQLPRPRGPPPPSILKPTTTTPFTSVLSTYADPTLKGFAAGCRSCSVATLCGSAYHASKPADDHSPSPGSPPAWPTQRGQR